MAEYAVMPKSDYQDACDAVREKTGGTDTIKSGQLGEQIRSISTGVELPALTNPAGENDVRSGKDYIDADGARRYGRLYMDGVWTPGWEVYVPVEVQYDSDDRYLVMSDGSSFGDATPQDVAKGVYFTSENGVCMEGEAEGGGSPETVTVTIAVYAGSAVVGYTGADGVHISAEMESTVEVVKGSLVAIEYKGNTYLVDRGGSGYETVYDGNVNGGSYCIMLRFTESGSVVFEEV